MERRLILPEKILPIQLPFLLSGLAMLRHLGLTENAAIIENALLYTLEQGIHTGDFGDKIKTFVEYNAVCRSHHQQFW